MQLNTASPYEATLYVQWRERQQRYAAAGAKLRAEENRAREKLRLAAQAKAEKEAEERREREEKFVAEYEAQKAKALEQYGWAEVPSPKIRCIIEVTGRHFGVTPLDIVSSRRTAAIVLPRQIAMYLAKIMTPKSLPEIGRCFGGKDHTTVLHAIRKIERLLKRPSPEFIGPPDETIKSHVEAIAAKVEAARPATVVADAP